MRLKHVSDQTRLHDSSFKSSLNKFVSEMADTCLILEVTLDILKETNGWLFPKWI